MAQKWEYKVLTRFRNAFYTDNLQTDITVGDWEYSEDGKELGARDLFAKLRELGDAGWELVSVVPQSAGTGGAFAGFTSHVMWTFKRPK